MNRQKPARSKTSRSFAVVAVAVLLTIAIAGIVLARFRNVPTDSPTTQVEGAKMTGAASAQAQPSDPNEVVFPASSDKLPFDADDKLTRIANEVRGNGKTIVIAAQVESPDYQGPEATLARTRAVAIRHVLEDAGVSLSSIRTQITQVGPGRLDPGHADRFEVRVR